MKVMDNDYQALLIPPQRLDLDWGIYSSVVIRCLHSVGYADTAERLEQETDTAISHQPMKLANLTSQFIGGFWEKCAETLLRIDGLTEKKVSGALFIIFQMWLEERMPLDRSFSHLKVTRNENIHHLSQGDREKLYAVVRKIRKRIREGITDGLNGPSHPFALRESMLIQLVDSLPNVSWWKKLDLVYAQIHSCLYHNTKDVIALCCNHSCRDDQLPTKNVQSSKGHTEAVLCVKFSHNGQYLASASEDCTAIIWEVPAGWKLEKRYVLQGHKRPVTCVSWSPNDESLLTCVRGENIKIWNIRTGKCTAVISEQIPVLRSCDFLLSDQLDIVYGTSGSIRLLRNGCDSQLSRSRGFSIDDFVVTPNGKKLIYKDEIRKFTVMDIGTGYCESVEEEEEAIICGFSVSEDSESLVLSLSNNEIHVWDLNKLKDKPLTYWGYKKATFVTHPCFGGVDSRFLACGADDGKVRIWNRRNGMPIAVLEDHHPSAVRCVSWNPKRPQMLACAGDDRTISIWGPRKL